MHMSGTAVKNIQYFSMFMLLQKKTSRVIILHYWNLDDG